MVYRLYSSLHRYLLLPLIVLFLFLPSIGHCNDIQISNSKISESSEEGVRFVEFDLSWDNSWRTDNLVIDDGRDVGNWDAAWIFVKYRVAGSVWKHAKLLMDGHELGTGTNATIQVGVPDQNADWHALENPGVGAMVYRSETGSGTFAVEQMKLRWDYGTDNLDPEAEYILEIYAIEMVSVMPGPYFLGSGGSEESRFIAGGSSTNEPFLVTSEWNGCISDTEGCLWATGDMDEGGVLPEGYPTGWDGFYVMKYEISQQQYVDFLNTLTPEQASERAYTGGANRNGITQEDGYYVTSRPYVANNYMSWEDGISYLDWAGLRPLTELEFEKAARGYADPVADEYAWGDTELVLAEGLASAGGRTETVVPESANAHGNSSIDGPVRVGVFADSTSTRVTSGASYWGVMELSGNVWERVITVGNEVGRMYDGIHGDGDLTEFIENTSMSSLHDLANLNLSGFRGAGWLPDSSEWLTISFRKYATDLNPGRFYDFGFRGSRKLNIENYTTLTVSVKGNGIVTPTFGLYPIGSTIQIIASPDDGIDFLGWSGDLSEDSTTVVVTMDTDIFLAAEFARVHNGTIVEEVLNPATGRIWMDRNLGASKPASYTNDGASYGDLYQWGRAADGHEKRDSELTASRGGCTPNHGMFIYTYSEWCPRTDNLWQGDGGINDPCPTGFRVPTSSEWQAEWQTWSDGAMGSVLKLPTAGKRDYGGGSIGNLMRGEYWSSSAGAGGRASSFYLDNFDNPYRATGLSVRCIKN